MAQPPVWIAYGEPDLPAAAGLCPVHSAGLLRRAAVRSAAALPPPPAQADGPAGQPVLSDGGGRRLPLPAAVRRGGAAGLRHFGRAGGRGAVFRRLLRNAAAHMGLLGGYAGLFGTFAVDPSDLDKKFLRENGVSGKKPLLFCAEMLYNKKNRAAKAPLERRRRPWQKRPIRQKRPSGGLISGC